MRDERDFDNIIDGMGGTPSPMMPPPPPPSRTDNLAESMKILFASIVVFTLQALTIAIGVMVVHSTIVEEYGFTVSGIGFSTSLLIAVFAILIGSSLRRATG